MVLVPCSQDPREGKRMICNFIECFDPERYSNEAERMYLTLMLAERVALEMKRRYHAVSLRNTETS